MKFEWIPTPVAGHFDSASASAAISSIARRFAANSVVQGRCFADHLASATFFALRDHFWAEGLGAPIFSSFDTPSPASVLSWKFVELVTKRIIPISVTLARGCRAKGPGIRDSSHARQGRRAGMAQAQPPAAWAEGSTSSTNLRLRPLGGHTVSRGPVQVKGSRSNFGRS